MTKLCRNCKYFLQYYSGHLFFSEEDLGYCSKRCKNVSLSESCESFKKSPPPEITPKLIDETIEAVKDLISTCEK